MEVKEIKFDDKVYPKRLKLIENAPKKIYVLGNDELLNCDGIAIVGSRDCTKEGAKNAKMFAANIANAGFTIVSGMAKGIDTEAHRGALEVKRKNYCGSWKWT